jgi:hemerythrin-like metal-binding protein
MSRESFSNVDEIKRQHKKLSEMVGALREVGKNGAEEVTEVLKKLETYSKAHFKYEESVAELCEYPDIDELKAHRKEFLRIIKCIKNNFLAFPHDKSVEPEVILTHLTNILNDWIEIHSEVFNKDFMDFLKECHKNN